MTEIGVIPGRFNPATLAHAKLFKKALAENKSGVYVVLVKGIESDRGKNPLNTATQEKLIYNLVPDVNIMEASAASLPEIIYDILEPAKSLYFSNEFKFTFYCGSDRYAPYKKQAETPEYIQDVIDELADQGFDIKKIDVEVKLIDRKEDKLLNKMKIDYSKPPTDSEISTYSASAVRKAIAEGDKRLAMRMMGITDEDFYEKIESAILAGLQKEAVGQSINTIMEKVNGKA